MILIKGKSIFYDFTKEGEDTTDSQTCTYYIKRDDKITDKDLDKDLVNNDDMIVLQGELPKDNNIFMLRIKGEDTAMLEVGYYIIRVVFEDTDNGYVDYILNEELQVID